MDVMQISATLLAFYFIGSYCDFVVRFGNKRRPRSWFGMLAIVFKVAFMISIPFALLEWAWKV